MKRILAMTVACIMLLMPMTGSAVTWGTIVSGINSTGTYNDGEINAGYDEQNNTVYVAGARMEKKGLIDGTIYFDSDTVDKIRTNAPMGVTLWNVHTTGSVEAVSKEAQFVILNVRDSEIDNHLWYDTYDGLIQLNTIGNVDVGGNVDSWVEGNEAVSAIFNDGELNASNVIVRGYDGKVFVFNSGELNSTEGNLSALLQGDGDLYLSNYGDITNADGTVLAKVVFYTDEAPENVDIDALIANHVAVEGDANVEDLDIIVIENGGGNEEAPDWEPSPYERLAHEMEEKRQAQAAGNVMASPWWCYQLNLGYASRNFWVRGKDGERIFHKSFTSFIPNEAGEDRKSLTLQVKSEDMTGVNIRFDESVLDVFDRVFIEQINVVNENNEPYMQYQVADLRAAREKYGLQPEELLLVGGTNDEVMKGTDHDGEFVSVESSEDAKEEAAEETAVVEAAEEKTEEAAAEATEEVKQEAAETK